MEKVQFRIVFVGVLRERWESQFILREEERTALRFDFLGLVVGEDYVWCLVLS